MKKLPAVAAVTPLVFFLCDASAQAAQTGAQGSRPVESNERLEPAGTPRGAVEEVIVTAQKRQERLQDVPISITAMGGVELDRSTAQGVTEALNTVPGVAAIQYAQGVGTNMTVRGVSASSPTFNGSTPVAYYLDAVPFGLVKSAITPDASAYDMERVEVLRGPQGTLYGASALNGVVRVLTRDPNLREFDFKARTSASTTEYGGESYRGDMAVNVPIIDGKLAVRAAAGYQDLGGWIDNRVRKDSNDGEISTVRLKIGAQPTDDLSIVASAWSSRSDFGAPNQGDDNQFRDTAVDESMTTDYDVYGLKIDYDFAGATLTSATGYLDYTSDGGGDIGVLAPGLVLTSGFRSHVFYQELILTSSHEGPWRWTVGGSYRDAQDRLIQTIPQAGFLFSSRESSESAAVFGEVGRRFANDKLELSLGGRYFEDDILSENPSMGLREAESFDSTTPRAVLTYFPNENVTFYGSYSEGFRSGAHQYLGTLPPDFPGVHPDTLKNYELGMKASLLDNRVTLDAAVYYIDWQDVQQSMLMVNPASSIPTTALINGESASGAGIDFGISARPTDGLDLGLTFSWNDLTMDSEVVSIGVVLFDAGDRLNFSPEYTAGVSADYTFPLGDSGFEALFSASANYTTETLRRTIVGDGRYVASGDPLLVARTSFTVRAPNHWEVSLFADNVSNEQGIVYGAEFAGTHLPDFDARIRPRTIGVQLDYRF